MNPLLDVPAPSLIAAGPWHDAEFASVRAAVEGDPPWRITPSIGDIIEHVGQGGAPPEIVLLAQHRPGCCEQADVERLRRLAPLARVIVVAGAWCEGELRTGRPLTGVVRIYWHQFPAWWRAALRRLAHGESPPWAEPLTDPRAAPAMPRGANFAAGQSRANAVDGRRLVVNTPDYAAYETLAAGMQGLGWNCQWQPRRRRVGHAETSFTNTISDAGIWDGGQLDEDELRELAVFCRRLGGEQATVAVLLDFPRAEHVAQACAAGAGAVIGKPYRVDWLHEELTRLTADVEGG